MSEWQLIETAPANMVVLTKIDDADGERNIAKLKRMRHLWYVPDGSVYVYYRPTHWQRLPSHNGSQGQ